MIVEYDQELLSPIGVVRDQKQLRGREVVVIEDGSAVMLVPRAGEDPRFVSLLQIVCSLVPLLTATAVQFVSCSRTCCVKLIGVI